MNEPTRHHFVPVFYLKQWAGPDGKIAWYSRPRDRVRVLMRAPSAIGFERKLYQLGGDDDPDRNAIETTFMAPAVDGPAALALAMLLDRDTSKLTDQGRVDWVRFLMSLRVRGPHVLSQLGGMAEAELRTRFSLAPEEYEAVRTPDDPDTLVEFIESRVPALFGNFGKSLLPQIIENPKVGTALLRMKWWKVTPKDGPDLLTGDNPFFMSSSLDDPRCVVMLPISPSSMFVATQGKDVFQALMSRGTKVLARDLNALVVRQAREHVFAHHKRHLRFVDNRLVRKGRTPPRDADFLAEP